MLYDGLFHRAPLSVAMTILQYCSYVELCLAILSHLCEPAAPHSNRALISSERCPSFVSPSAKRDIKILLSDRFTHVLLDSVPLCLVLVPFCSIFSVRSPWSCCIFCYLSPSGGLAHRDLCGCRPLQKLQSCLVKLWFHPLLPVWHLFKHFIAF